MKLCYFGIYDPEFGRNKVYLRGLRESGVEIIECQDSSPGLGKFWRLWQKHRAIVRAGGYDAMIVGYPGHLVVPLAKLISRRPVVFDALCTLYEGEVMSRGKYRLNLLMRGWIMLVDLLAAKSADLILVETHAQEEFFIKRFSLPAGRVFRVFTGADEDIYHPEPGIAKREKFTAVFRGRLLPEAGVKYLVQAAKLLESSGVDFRIIGGGQLEKEVWSLIKQLKPANLEWIREYLPPDVLRQRLLECHVALGQFEKHGRLERTIPHKAFESLALGLPYVTGRAAGISELLTDGKDCLMVNLADPEDIAAKVLQLKNDPTKAEALAKNGHLFYLEHLTPIVLGKSLIKAVDALIPAPVIMTPYGKSRTD